MGFKAVLGSLLACSVSSDPLDAGYGAPQAAPLFLPHPAAPLPFHPVHAPLPHHAAPLPFLPVHAPPPTLTHSHAQPIFHSIPQPLIHPLPAPTPLDFSPERLAIGPAPLPFAAEPLHLAPQPLLPAPLTVPSSQFHAQDEFGGFSFGYENINSAKTESRDAFGVTRGSYQYVDANGLIQTVNYISDDVNGFRVAGTNIPTAPALAVGPADTPEVAAARAAHLAAHEEAKAAAAERKRRSPEEESTPEPEAEPEPEPEAEDEKRKKREAYGKREAEPIDGGYLVPSAPVLALSPLLPHAPLTAPIFHVPQPAHAPFLPAPQPFFAPEPIAITSPAFIPERLAIGHAPLPFAPEPLHLAPQPLLPAPLTVPSSQFHAQDEFGQFSFGYENINSAKTESRDAFGVTRGSYQYVDANGLIQTVNYISDDVNGFRVAGTNIPVAPAAVFLAGPAPVLETPEVAAARAAHKAAHAEAEAAVAAANAEAED